MIINIVGRGMEAMQEAGGVCDKGLLGLTMNILQKVLLMNFLNEGKYFSC